MKLRSILFLFVVALASSSTGAHAGLRGAPSQAAAFASSASAPMRQLMTTAEKKQRSLDKAAAKRAAAAKKAAAKEAAAQAKNASKAAKMAAKKAAADAKHAHKHAEPTPAPTMPPTHARVFPAGCAPGEFGHDHKQPLAGGAAPLAWMNNADGTRNRHNNFPQRIAESCCSAEAAAEEVTVGWTEFLAAQGACAQFAPVTIPCGTRVLVDGSVLDGPIELAGLYVEGALEFVDGADVELRTDFLFNCGTIAAGTTERRHESVVDIVLTNFHDVWFRGSAFGRTGFVTYGGETFLRGSSCDRPTWTRLAATAEAGTNALTVQLDDVAAETAWRVGDQLLVVTTGGQRSVDESEVATIAGFGGDDGRTVRLAAPLANKHLGCEQDGEDNVVPGGIPCVMAAEVAPLTRNLRVRGEAACSASRMCGHFLLAHTNHGTVCGVEFSNLGQKTTKGRYALHLHAGWDAAALVVRSNAIHDTHNRGIVVHAMRHVRVEDNTVFNTLGHNIMLEDGVEEHNALVHNLGVAPRSVSWGCKSSHDNSFTCGGRSDGAANSFWINNANNEVRDNAGVAHGMAFRIESRHVMGDTRLWFHPEAMKIGHNGKIKGRTRMGKFVGNVAHSSHTCFFNYPMLNPTNGREAGYENLVGWNCQKGISVKNTGSGGAMNIIGATLVGNTWGIVAHIPAAKIMVRASHIIGFGSALPFNMKKTSSNIKSLAGSVFADEQTKDWARCHGGFSNPHAAIVLGSLSQDGCDVAAPIAFPATPEQCPAGRSPVFSVSAMTGPAAVLMMTPEDLTPPGLAIGSAKEGTCTFPFVHQGATYTNCAETTAAHGVGWCSFDSIVGAGKAGWGYCSDDCDEFAE